MAYGTLKVDNITYTSAGVDASTTVSGLVEGNFPNITITGTISGTTITGDTGDFTTITAVTGIFTTTLSGATVTGATAQFTTLTGGTAGFTTITGQTITGTTGQFGTVTGNTAGFTTVTGATVTGTTGQFGTVTGNTAGFTTVTGQTVTGTAGQFGTVTGNTAGFTTVTGTTVTGTTGQFGTITGNTAGFTTVTGTTVTGATGSFTTVTGQTINDSKGDVRDIPQNSQTTSYILVAGDAGKHVFTTAGVTVPSGVFTVGEAVSIYNNTTGDLTITQGVDVTLRQAGASGTGNRTLAQRGLATVLCVSGASGTEFVIAGNIT
jgi:hypothetical protein